MKVTDHASFFTGPAAMVLGCKHCGHVETIQRRRGKLPGGRGAGWYCRNDLTRRMRLHLELKHNPEIIAAAKRGR